MDGQKVVLIEEWETKEHHEKYLKWRLDNGLAQAIEPFVSGFSTVYLNTKDEY